MRPFLCDYLCGSVLGRKSESSSQERLMEWKKERKKERKKKIIQINRRWGDGLMSIENCTRLSTYFSHLRWRKCDARASQGDGHFNDVTFCVVNFAYKKFKHDLAISARFDVKRPGVICCAIDANVTLKLRKNDLSKIMDHCVAASVTRCWVKKKPIFNAKVAQKVATEVFTWKVMFSNLKSPNI